MDVLSREEIQAMEDAAQTERDKILVHTLADTGIRVGKLVALRRPTSTSRAATSTGRFAGRVAGTPADSYEALLQVLADD